LKGKFDIHRIIKRKIPPFPKDTAVQADTKREEKEGKYQCHNGGKYITSHHR
jgi:hypothetical protein